MSTEKAADQQAESVRGDPEFLVSWMRWAVRFALGIGIFFLILFAIRRSPASLIIGGALVGFVFPTLFVGLRMAQRGKMVSALVMVSTCLWGVALLVAARGTVTLAGMLALLLLPVILAAPYISRGSLLRLVLVATGFCAIAATLAARPFLPSTIPNETLSLIAIPITTLTVGLAMLGLWQMASHLRTSLMETRATNRALAESERSLERKVEERTGELASKNTELERSQRALATARDEALAANRAKSAFLANMSHELRTPLNAIIGYSEMLQEEAQDLGQESLVPDLEKILTAGRHLLGLINDVLDLSKIEAGKMDVFAERFDIAEMVKGIATTVQPLIGGNANSLEVSDLDGIGTMRSDVTKIRQILFNLLSNAAKFTKKGTIQLGVVREERDGESWIEFCVADSGIGMTPKQVDKIFEEFRQADSSTSREFGGTGLGLAITKRFCELLGGEITVKSELGRGSEFRVRVAAELPEETAAAEPVQPTEIEEGRNTGITILVIDDDPVARDLISRHLVRDGFRVVVASGGEEGLQLARETHPDMITLDVLMPGMDGWVVLSTLKADPELAEIPVMLVSITDDQNLGYTLGASEFLTKPIDWRRLSAILRRYESELQAGPVLVVDDDASSRELLCRMIEKGGWAFTEAENGRVALERVAAERPSLILLDLMMPEMNGFELAAALRENESWRSIPIVVITAKELTAEDRRSLNGNVETILKKEAYTRAELLDEVRNIVGARMRAGTRSQAQG